MIEGNYFAARFDSKYLTMRRHLNSSKLASRHFGLLVLKLDQGCAEEDTTFFEVE